MIQTMIRLNTYNGSGYRTNYVSAKNIARITEASTSSQWHGIRSIVRLFDGETLEVSETADWISAEVEKCSAQS
jgi:NTP pyrophosphatase (non-canonical NTP hydrolase)